MLDHDYGDETKTERVTVFLSPRFKRALEAAARADQRSLSDWARVQFGRALLEDRPARPDMTARPAHRSRS